MDAHESAADREALAIEEADAWFEYLEATRQQCGSGRYDEVETWAWGRLKQRLAAVHETREQLGRAAA